MRRTTIQLYTDKGQPLRMSHARWHTKDRVKDDRNKCNLYGILNLRNKRESVYCKDKRLSKLSCVGSSGASQNGENESFEQNAESLSSSGMDEARKTIGAMSLPENFSIIESQETVKDFAKMAIKELQDNVSARRNTIFLLMEEIRRLRIQLRLREREVGDENLDPSVKFSSAIPFLPPISNDNLQLYYITYSISVTALIIFGGLIAPVLELRLGLGGVSYFEFIEHVHLPKQLALVDPIVASFVGGAVGVLSSLLVVEVNNVKEREKEKCFYCEGEGYLACGACGGAGKINGESCPTCSGTGKVMCTTCLCTGRLMATEHDQRIDPFV